MIERDWDRSYASFTELSASEISSSFIKALILDSFNGKCLRHTVALPVLKTI